MESLEQGAQTHLPIPTQKFSNQLLVSINLNFFRHAKNQVIS